MWCERVAVVGSMCFSCFLQKMVLAELGTRITNALRSVGSKTVIDKEAVDAMLKEIGNALVAADVNFKLVMTMRSNLLAKLVRRLAGDGVVLCLSLFRIWRN